MAQVERIGWDKPLEHRMEHSHLFSGALKEFRLSYHTGPALKSKFSSRISQIQLPKISNSDPENLKFRSRISQIQIQKIPDLAPESLLSNSAPGSLRFGSRISQIQLHNLLDLDPESRSRAAGSAQLLSSSQARIAHSHFISWGLHPFLTSPQTPHPPRFWV